MVIGRLSEVIYLKHLELTLAHDKNLIMATHFIIIAW